MDVENRSKAPTALYTVSADQVNRLIGFEYSMDLMSKDGFQQRKWGVLYPNIRRVRPTQPDGGGSSS
jgi:hypothetical protein